jgi:hypothetical protein
MHHSTIDLTMNVCTDPKLLDVAGAMESLPTLPPRYGGPTVANVLNAMDTDDSIFSPLAPATGKASTLQAIVDRIVNESRRPASCESVAASAYLVNRNNPLTTTVNGLCKVEPTGIEPATSWMQTRRSPN